MTRAAVIGLGTMGAGIAAVMARAGLAVRAFDPNPEAVARSQASLPVIAGVLDRLGMPTKGDATDVDFCPTLAAATAGADLVLENGDTVLVQTEAKRLDELRGTDDFVLLEEPQAAVYAWLAAQGNAWRRQLQEDDRILADPAPAIAVGEPRSMICGRFSRRPAARSSGGSSTPG